MPFMYGSLKLTIKLCVYLFLFFSTLNGRDFIQYFNKCIELIPCHNNLYLIDIISKPSGSKFVSEICRLN